jgi:hypothetical protein
VLCVVYYCQQVAESSHITSRGTMAHSVLAPLPRQVEYAVLCVPCVVCCVLCYSSKLEFQVKTLRGVC